MLSTEKISKKDLNLLLHLANYLVLLNEQIAQLSGTGLRAVQKRINKLNQNGFINIITQSYKAEKGRSKFISSLSEKGIKLLQNEKQIDNKISHDRFLFNKTYTIEHELLVNWFHIYLDFLPIKIPVLGVDFISATTPFLPLKSNGLPLISESFKEEGPLINFAPDGVFSIINKEKNKSLLFFLEVDMGTESLNTSSLNSNNIATKIKNYRAYFRSKKYKRYEKRWDTKFNGFRLLFLTNSVKRKSSISNFVNSNNSNEFIWVANQHDMFEKGLAGNIWSRGGNVSASQESILGKTLTFN